MARQTNEMLQREAVVLDCCFRWPICFAATENNLRQDALTK